MTLLTPLLLSLFASSAVSALPGALHPRQDSSPTVSTSGYTYVGTSSTQLGSEQFMGIPFAQPPVGSKRLRPPEPLPQGNGTRVSVTQFGPSCIQPSFLGLSLGPISEDCLTLNVIRPKGVESGANLPVLFWIYGGGFEIGGTNLYDGTGLVARSSKIGKPTIYVSANYRVGPLGFMSSAELAAEGSLNLGYLDQRSALQWVKDNIGKFGGDPNKVTVFGESAGSISVSHHLLYNGGNKDDLLFRGAIMESGGPTTSVITAPDTPSRQQVFNDLATKVGCRPSNSSADYSSTLECIRAAPSENFAPGNMNISYFPSPVADGKFLTTTPAADIRAGKYAKVPFIAGSNRDEGTFFLATGFLPSGFAYNTSQDIIDSFNGWNGFEGGQLLSFYPEDPAAGAPFGVGGNSTFGWGQQGRRAAAIWGDLGFVGPRRLLSQVASKTQPVFGYNFEAIAEGTPENLGSTHFAEVPFVYLNSTVTNVPAQAQLASAMADYWINFANDLNPNGNGSLPHWPEYKDDPAGALINFNIGNISSITDDFRKEGVQFIVDHSP